MNFDSDFTAINVNYLVPDMKIDFNIYYKTYTAAGMEYVLLCQNIVLNDNLIKKFRRVTAPEYIIYVPNQNYQATFKSMIEGLADEASEVHFDGYNDVKESSQNFLNSISETKQVSKETADVIAEDIKQKLATVSASDIIQSINSLRKVDEYLHTHSVNVSFLNGLIGKWLKYDAKKLQTLIDVGLLHDIGKLQIPPEVLNKPAKLTPEEFDIMKLHPVYSYNMLVDSNITDEDILEGVLQHHEKMNGTGYPNHLSAEHITEFARITSISDVYDAMVAKRVYKDAHSPFEILSWFQEGCYSDLDINLVNVFLDCMIEELKGKQVLLSDNSIATVSYVHKSDFEFPIVQLNGETIRTNKTLSCVRMI